MSRVLACSLLLALSVTAAGCGAATRRAVDEQQHFVTPVANRETGPRFGPFAVAGGFAGGGSSGLWGDGASGPQGTTLGCLDGRHYSYAFGLENRSRVPVTLTSARGTNPAPMIVQRVATQFRLSPPGKATTGNWSGPSLALVYHRWSAEPLRAVTVPPGRIATVQANFLIQHCKTLAPGERVVVPGSLVIGYRQAGHSRRKEIALPETRFAVIPGPTKRSCAAVPGSASMVAADVGCGLATRVARACHPMSHPTWGDCTVGGRLWDCGSFAGPGYPHREICYLPHEKSHWVRTIWMPSSS
jgi:hypothetical protein